MSGILAVLLSLLLTALSPVQAETASARTPSEPANAWMKVEKAVVPLRENTVRGGAILGYAQSGEVLALEKEGHNWVKLRLNDSVSGWVPRSLVSPSGPPVHLDSGRIKWTFLALLGLLVTVLLALALKMHFKRRAESLERTRQALADAKRRLQNKIQLLFRAEPRIASHLVMDEVDAQEFLRNIGYQAQIEKEPSRFLAACKAFKPNLIIAAAEFREQVEGMAVTDALLINTPVIYLGCDQVPEEGGPRVRANLEVNATDKDLGTAISFCLRRSPEKIRYSVKPVALKGEVRGGTMVELLHFLATVKRSGQLLAVDGSDRGEVLLHKGEIVGAAFKGQTGARGTEQLLNLASGSFEFHEKGTKAVAEAINTHKLLLDWTKTRDERDHDSGT
jgi:hypothetical protein